ncbi:MAG: EamA family transporter RarD [Planktomarina sp.]|nr:EamA family transporter RarD [Planktomarina sp.]|tara:strand:- start:205 stop:1107 length:903 start_codon:yes stop_codon:yes gene_type:complete
MESLKNRDSPAGLAFAVSAYLMWGGLPLYMKLLDHVPAAEVVAHRVVWSVPIAMLVLVALGRTSDLLTALASPRTLAMGVLTAALISLNWGIYVWAIGSGHALDAALGYYINPLFSMALGIVFLGERPSRSQIVAIVLAIGAVVIITLAAGTMPWVAIGLFVSWGFYALCKKQLPVGPNQGFLLEVLILLLPALAYIAWLSLQQRGHFLTLSWYDSMLLLGCGAVTAIPLMLYANGAKRLRLTTIAVLQYIAPTMIFLCAVLVFDEPLGQARMIAFPMIWAALVIYSITLIRQMLAAKTK